MSIRLAFSSRCVFSFIAFVFVIGLNQAAAEAPDATTGKDSNLRSSYQRSVKSFRHGRALKSRITILKRTRKDAVQ